jgi:excisionase family DNA binding protein
VLDLQERAVEVQRLTLALLAGRTPAVVTMPVPTVPTVPTRQPRKSGSGLLSKKAAARLLGVDRATTLEDWLSTGRIKAVNLDGRVRIPRAEVERVINEGIPDATGPQRPRTRPSPKAATAKLSTSPGAEIRKLKF